VTGEIGRDGELRLLAELCRELARLGWGVGVRDALPALAVPTGTPNSSLYVFVSASGEFYQWNETNHRHPVSDVPGAAAAIASFVQGRNGASKERGFGP
jgi:hypothetical protein